MRDKIKTLKYFDGFIAEDTERIKKFSDKLNNNEVKEDRILPVKTKIHDLKLGILIARYSKGEAADQIKTECADLVNEWAEVWKPETYIKNLWLISLGVLLNIDNNKLADVRRLSSEAGVKDWLYHFLLERESREICDGSGELIFPEVYGTLKKAVCMANNRMELLKKYISSEWYGKHQKHGWLGTHESTQNLYYGYWSFEAGAVAKILELDDQELAKEQYYPYDLMHFRG